MIKLKSLLLEAISKNAKNILYNKWKKENPNLNTDQMDHYINKFDENRNSNVFKSKDIMSYKFSDLEKLIDANFSEKTSGKFDISDKDSYQDDIVFENDELLIVSGNGKDKCIKYGKGESWCVSRTDINNMYYSYRMKYKYPAFYFVIDKTLPENKGNKKLVVMVTKDNEYTIADRGNGNDVGFGKNHGGEIVSWEYISKIQPKIKNLQKLFVPNPPTDKEIEMYRKFTSKLSINDFKQLTFEELEYYLSIKNSLTREQINHILTLPRAKELIRRYAVTTKGKNLTREIINKYLSPSDEKQLLSNMKATMNSDGTITIEYIDESNYPLPYKVSKVLRDLYIPEKQLRSLIGMPKEVGGNFNCLENFLTSLEGAPEYVGGRLNCSYNLLTTLEGAPKEVGEGFGCGHNQLTTLKGGPIEVGGTFDCGHNQLTSLEGAPEYVGMSFGCASNKLKTLKGGPKEVGGWFDCSVNQLTTLEGAPKKVGNDFDCSDNQLITLDGAPKEVDGNFDCLNNKLTTLESAPEYVGGNFNCSNNELTSLKGAPKYVGGWFGCLRNDRKFTEEEVRAVCNVKGQVIV